MAFILLLGTSTGATTLRAMQEPMQGANMQIPMQEPTSGIRPTTSIFVFVHDVLHIAKFAPRHSIARVPSKSQKLMYISTTFNFCSSTQERRKEKKSKHTHQIAYQ